MPASSEKYGVILTERGGPFHPDEPLFLIRAADVCAPGTVRDYVQRCIFANLPGEHLEALAQVATRFAEWQEAHPELVKQPD